GVMGARRIGETVPYEAVASGERRLDQMYDVLAPCCEHQQQLHLMRHRLLEQRRAQRFAEGGAARLACRDDVEPACGERFGEPCGVRSLARAVDPLERDETAATRSILH